MIDGCPRATFNQRCIHPPLSLHDRHSSKAALEQDVISAASTCHCPFTIDIRRRLLLNNNQSALHRLVIIPSRSTFIDMCPQASIRKSFIIQSLSLHVQHRPAVARGHAHHGPSTVQCPQSVQPMYSQKWAPKLVCSFEAPPARRLLHRSLPRTPQTSHKGHHGASQ